MAVSHVNTQTGTTTNGTSVTVAKPTGLASGDLITAFVTTNYQGLVTPNGWTKIGEQGIETFLVTVLSRVADGTEAANFIFSFSGSPANAPMLGQVSAWRGIDTSDAIDIDPVMSTSFNSSEPLSTESVTGGLNGRLIYFRASRRSGSSPITFTASGVTEISDAGVFSGGSVCYSGGLYMANADYSTSGSKSGLAITANATETHNVTLTMGIKSGGNPGTLDVDLPSIPTMSASGSVAYPAELEVVLPRIPDAYVQFEGWNGNSEGTLDVQVPVDVSIAGSTPPLGTLNVLAGPIVDFVGETRRFAENVVTPERDERTVLVTEQGWRRWFRPPPNPRHAKPVVVVARDASVALGRSMSAAIPVTAAAYGAAVARGSAAPSAGASVTAYSPTVMVRPNAGTVTASVAANQPTTSGSGEDMAKFAQDVGNGTNTTFTITHSAGTRDVSVTVYENASPYEEVQPLSKHATTTTVTVEFASAPSTNQYRVLVLWSTT